VDGSINSSSSLKNDLDALILGSMEMDRKDCALWYEFENADKELETPGEATDRK
jgi:hypothetical protein